MLLDARELSAESTLECELCIIGGGAAGITIARELAGTDIRVVLLESGGLGPEKDTQDLYAGTIEGSHYPSLTRCRLRYLGGTTNHWGGNCSPLDPIDFATRPWVEHSGWPFTREHLDPFYARAQEYCQLGPFQYNPQYWAEQRGESSLDFNPNVLETGIAQGSPPTQFGTVYREDLRNAQNVQALLHANMVKIALSTDEHVESVKATVLGGSEFTVKAKHYVLAMGGIENARMLLTQTDRHKDGIGNQHDLVGRFFMDHPVIEGAVFIPSDPKRWPGLYTSKVTDGHVSNAFLKLSDAALEKEGLLNARMPFEPITNYRLSEGIESLHEITGAFGDFDWPDNMGRHIANVAGDLDMVLESVSRSVFGYKMFDSASETAGYVFNAMIDPVPDPNNRVRLGSERDALGLQRPHLTLNLSERDRANLWRCYEIAASQLGALGAGRVKLLREREDALWEDKRWLSFGNHHMGTTRAHDDPKQGVVDANLRVHGMHNLHIAGSSVFPTGGSVPPTLTIVALALRLSQRLKQEFRNT